MNPAVKDLGWYYLPVVLLSASLLLSSALLFNNIRRRYPLFWFSPSDPTTVTIAPLGYLDAGPVTSEKEKFERLPEKIDNLSITIASLARR